MNLDCAYRLDLLIDDLVVVELKSVEAIESIHEAQLLTYLRLRNSWLGMIINFNVKLLRNGIKRGSSLFSMGGWVSLYSNSYKKMSCVDPTGSPL